jgi:hypothetical protein
MHGWPWSTCRQKLYMAASGLVIKCSFTVHAKRCIYPQLEYAISRAQPSPAHADEGKVAQQIKDLQVCMLSVPLPTA